MVTDGNQAYTLQNGDHFVMYKNIESLCYTPETNVIYDNSTKHKVS